MRRVLARRFKNERGQSIVTLALAMLFFMSLLAVVGDTAFVWWQRRDLQNTADAAALAGAQELNSLASSETPAKTRAAEWADKNVSNLTSMTSTVSDGYKQIEVSVSKPSKSLFGATLGFGNPTITAKATARIRAPLLPGPGVVPLAVNEDTYNECLSGGNCTNITLKEWSGNNTDPPSDYHLLDLPGGSGASDVCDFLIGGGTNPIQDPVDNQPGNVSSLHNCLDNRLAAASANGCLDLADVLDSDGKLNRKCNPLDLATRGSLAGYPDAQPTAVILVPVIKNFCNGSCGLDIVGDGAGVERTFAFFWVNSDTVYGPNPTCVNPGGGGNREQTAAGVERDVLADHQPNHNPPGRPPTNTPTATRTPTPTSTPTLTPTPGGPAATNTPVPTPTPGNGGGGGSGQCDIHGQFIQGYQTTLVTDYNSENGEFDPNSLVKIIQLID